MIASLTKDDLEWLDRVGVNDRRMRIIKKNQEYVDRVGKIHLDEIGKNKVIVERIKRQIKLLEEDHTSEMADCNDYIIDILKGVLE